MKTLTSLFLLSLLCLGPLAARAESTFGLHRADLVNLMVGEYIVVGRMADSNVTYSGRLTFRNHGRKLGFTRTIGGKVVRGVATLELTVVGDPAPVLRMSFDQGGRRYDSTFQWMFDLDNYARFTGYVYRPDDTTKQVGLEMLFPLQPSVRD